MICIILKRNRSDYQWEKVQELQENITRKATTFDADVVVATAIIRRQKNVLHVVSEKLHVCDDIHGM
jgi:hypothetical protein